MKLCTALFLLATGLNRKQDISLNSPEKNDNKGPVKQDQYLYTSHTNVCIYITYVRTHINVTLNYFRGYDDHPEFRGPLAT